MTSVMRYTKEVGGSDKYYKVSAIPGIGFPVVRNRVWTKMFTKSTMYYANNDYYVVRDLGGEAPVTSIDPLLLTDYLHGALEASQESFLDYQILQPGWARRVQLILTPEVGNSGVGPFSDGNEVAAEDGGGGTIILSDFLQTPIGPSPTLVGGESYDMPGTIPELQGFMKTKYHIFNAITRPLIIQYRVEFNDGVNPPQIITRQRMFKNSMSLLN
jgi:hypothetical protein